MKKNLTLRYTLQQMAYWVCAAGLMSFGSAFLMAKGFEAAQVGVLLAAGNLLSCAVQPLLAGRADKAGSRLISRYVLGLAALCFVSLGIMQLLPLAQWAFGLLYLTAVFAFDAMLPMLNALCVAYNDQGVAINYGLSRGVGSFAYALAALGLGQVMAGWGVDWMIWIVMAMMAANIAVTLGYPPVERRARAGDAPGGGISVARFFLRYKWFCLSLCGVMLLAMFHAMTENYLIRIMERLGGNSSSVGVALFIATAIEMVVLVFFDRIRRRLSDPLLMKLAGLSFLLKALLFLWAPSVGAIYAIQTLQATSYSFLAPTQMYYARSRTAPQDMVKGQAFITASYTLGCAAGNFLGGQLLQAFNVPVLLICGVALALAGTLTLFLTVNRKDQYLREAA